MAPSHDPAPVADHTSKPPGVLPKHLQSWVSGGLALAMVLVIAFSSRKSPKEPTEPIPHAPTASEPSEARIQEVRARLDQEAQRLADEQAKLARTKEVLGNPFSPDGPSAQREPSFPGEPYSRYSPTRERSWIELDREKREYESRYASNLALTKRKPEEAQPNVATGADVLTPAAQTLALESAAPVSAAKTYRIPEGTVIETVLTNRLDSTFSGPVNTLVTTNVHSGDRTKLLIPQGARILGSVKKVDTFGEQRLAITFERLLLPTGQAIVLPTVPGLSQVGETGLLDQVNHHYGQVFGVALAIGAIAGLSQAGTAYGATTAASDVYRQGVSNSLAQTSLNILDRYLNVVPTFTVREGTRVKVFLTADLDLPAYSDPLKAQH